MAKYMGKSDMFWWRSLINMSPELRAKMFFSRFRMETPKVRDQLIKRADDTPGFATERFMAEFEKQLDSLEEGGK